MTTAVQRPFPGRGARVPIEDRHLERQSEAKFNGYMLLRKGWRQSEEEDGFY